MVNSKLVRAIITVVSLFEIALEYYVNPADS
jgi:hypothetical protein